MNKYNRVIDKYWIQFLVYTNKTRKVNMHDYTGINNFWEWFYRTLSHEDVIIASQKWNEAQLLWDDSNYPSKGDYE